VNVPSNKVKYNNWLFSYEGQLCTFAWVLSLLGR